MANQLAHLANGNCGLPGSEAGGGSMEPLAAAVSFFHKLNRVFKRLQS
jgi:hypothetical protein